MALIFAGRELVDGGKMMVIGEADSVTVVVEPVAYVKHSIEGQEFMHIGGRYLLLMGESIGQQPISKLSWE